MGKVRIDNKQLVEIFKGKQDLQGTNLLEMSDFLGILLQNAKEKFEVSKKTKWKSLGEVPETLVGLLSTAIILGIDIKGMSTLVADSSHFGKEITDGLKSGIYHIGQSREVSGKLRPAIVDKNEKLVKFFTLRKAVNPSEVLKDVALYSIQSSLKEISDGLNIIRENVEYLTAFERREAIDVKFMNARGCIISASCEKNATRKEALLFDADKYLLEGMNSLYSDVNAEIKSLANLRKKEQKIEIIDGILRHICEDISVIPRFVGLRSYLLVMQEKSEMAWNVIDEYKAWLVDFTTEHIDKHGHSGAELVHEYFPYYPSDIDYWIEQPVKMIDAIDTCSKRAKIGVDSVYYITAEDVTHGEKMQRL